jgi:hypothetical protein
MALPQYNLGSKMNRPVGRNPVGPPNMGASTVVSPSKPPGIPQNGPNTSRVMPARMSGIRMQTTPERGGAAPSGPAGSGGQIGAMGVKPPAKIGGPGKFKYQSNMGAQKFTPSRERTIA